MRERRKYKQSLVLFSRKYVKLIEECLETFLKGTTAKHWKQAGSSIKRSIEEVAQPSTQQLKRKEKMNAEALCTTKKDLHRSEESQVPNSVFTMLFFICEKAGK